jgi:hypothetical protein
MPKRLLILTLCLPAAFGPPPLRASDPAAAFAAAAADARRLPADRALFVRYFWRPPYSADLKENRKRLAERADFDACWLNFLSREADLVKPVGVAGDVWRFFLDDYRIDPKVWEKLLDVEPWFHARILVAGKKEAKAAPRKEDDLEDVVLPTNLGRRRVSFDGGRTWVDQVRVDGDWMGYPEARKKFAPKKPAAAKRQEFGKPGTAAAAGDWLGDPRNVADLITLTQSQVPLVRADWFLFQSGQQLERKAGYYDFLGLGKKLADFDRLVGANVEVSRELRRAHRAVVGRSTVTAHNRGMEGGATLTEGIRFLTEDYARNNDDKNPLRLLLGDAKPDGGEGLGNLPNGLIAMWVQDANGNRLDVVPPNIASDSASRNPDRQVHPGQCMRCHQEGYRPIADWARRIYAPPFRLESVDYRLQKQLQSAYLSQLEKFLAKGNATYSEALKALGYTPAAFSRAWGDAWSEYADADVDVETLERWTGLKDLREKFLAEAKRGEAAGKKLDPVLAGLVQGVPARVEWVEELVPEIYRVGRIP